jgi:hypothetical protein
MATAAAAADGIPRTLSENMSATRAGAGAAEEVSLTAAADSFVSMVRRCKLSR